MTVRIDTITGEALSEVISAVARLRIAVFREWPYLYDGTLSYEEGYLAQFCKATGAIIVTARDADDIVGVATAAPLMGHTEEFAPLFARHGLNPEQIFYCGESVLLPAYRGQGVGHQFFDRREAHAAALRRTGTPFTHAAFCAVVRSSVDERRPPGYRPLDPFWRKRGYHPVEGLTGSYSWRELGSDNETDHDMQFWLKPLSPV